MKIVSEFSSLFHLNDLVKYIKMHLKAKETNKLHFCLHSMSFSDSISIGKFVDNKTCLLVRAMVARWQNVTLPKRREKKTMRNGGSSVMSICSGGIANTSYEKQHRNRNQLIFTRELHRIIVPAHGKWFFTLWLRACADVVAGFSVKHIVLLMNFCNIHNDFPIFIFSTSCRRCRQPNK